MQRSLMRFCVLAICVAGFSVIAGAVVAPLVGLILAARQTAASSTEPVVISSTGPLLFRSMLLSLVATVGALLLAIAPAALLSLAGRRARRLWAAVCLAGLLIPPQVYAYAWDVATGPLGPLHGWLPGSASTSIAGSAIRAGLISAAWLWPLAAMILAAGWRTTGQGVYRLAILDATPTAACLRGVLPALRPYLAAAACLIFVITMIEYAIPHLCLARVYATEILLLVDAGAPNTQVAGAAGVVLLIVLAVAAAAAWCAWSLRAGGIEATDDDPATSPSACDRRIPIVAAAVWLLTVGLPLTMLLRMLNHRGAWINAWALFAQEWGFSLLTAALAAGMSLLLAVCAVLLPDAIQKRWPRISAAAIILVALVPPAALGVGFIVAYNRPGLLGEAYDRTPLVWAFSLTARFAAIAVAVTWITGRQHLRQLVQQARSDGAGVLDVLGYVLLPLSAPVLLASGVIVLLLACSEVVVTHLVGPMGFPSVALALLNQMHYGRDDVVIATSLTICAAGFLLALLCGTIMWPREPK